MSDYFHDLHQLSKTAQLASGLGEPSSWTRGGIQRWGLCESLLTRSQACRYDAPERMVLLAERAVSVAEELDPMEYGPELTADLRARALAELANAYRVADDHESAERAMRSAVEWSARGTRDPLLLARIMDLLASLRGGQRRMGEALALLDAVYEIYESHGDRHNAGRALISKGVFIGCSSDAEQAVVLLSAGLAMIQPAADPKLILSAVHNLVGFLADCRQFRQAQRLLRLSRQVYFAEGDHVNLIKLRWLEARIEAGLGKLDRAEKAFLHVRQELEKAGLEYQAALASLDLAAVWLRQGKVFDTRCLVEELVATFRARRIAREALAALLLLRESFETEAGTQLKLLRAVSGFLDRARHSLAANPR